ncbi:MAG TPA: fibronectin type III domain-containing protein, partial [Tepidisphaeraceae bacterium]|nr:fibronectin type III domain-containing protein [Tepidisphaeraceae bacterium]
MRALPSLVLLSSLAPIALAAKPPAPVGVAMVANAPDSITLAWYRPPADDATGYVVYAADKADGPFAKIATVTDRTATHAGLKPDITLFYKVAATNADGEGEPTKPVQAFTIKPAAPTPFPAKVATNMCVSLNATIKCDSAPVKGKLESLVDGSDATDCRLKDTCDIRIKINAEPSIADAEYLLVHFRTGLGPYDFANDPFARPLKAYTITESRDSTDGVDGTWTEVAKGTNTYLDGVIAIPNHKPKWIGVRNAGKRDLILCRLDVFRAVPAGFRNDAWIFTGDSLVVQDLPGGSIEGRTAFFSDLIRKRHPDRYP